MEKFRKETAAFEHRNLRCSLRNEINNLIIDYKIAWARWAVALTQSPRLRTYRYHNDGHDPTESSSKTFEELDLDEVWIDATKEWVDPVVDFIDAVFMLSEGWFAEQKIPLKARGKLIVEIATNPQYEPSRKDEPFATHVRLIREAAGISEDHFCDCRDARLLPPREDTAYRFQFLRDAVDIDSRFFTMHPGAQSQRSTGCPLDLRKEIIFTDGAWIKWVARRPPKHNFFQDVEGLQRLCRLLVEPSLRSKEVTRLLETFRPIIKGQCGKEPEDLAELYDKSRKQRVRHILP